ncbi:threonine synthase [Alteribacillus sp. HJP-4]|uniref:threonine synthase n=1 Tax=Alteribacillus sp. HJP-4 TaxID=2775394 RepID=UPI0035CD2C57
MKYRFIGSVDNREYIPNSTEWRPQAGLFTMKPYDVSFPIEKIKERPSVMSRYIEALPFAEESVLDEVTLGEGMTPLIPLDTNEPNVLVKLDYLMPTGSFKDRGAAVLIAKAKELGAEKVIADSSGNAGTAIAAYCARAGLPCHVYVPESASEKKLEQIRAHGAELQKVPGSRADTAEAAMTAVDEKKHFYASHVYNPFFYEGTKTFAFEIWEQLNFTVPDTLVLPVGNGTLVLGAFIGFQDLMNAGLITSLPKITAVQAEPCAPLAEAFRQNSHITPAKNEGTLAEGIAIENPPRAEQIMEAVNKTGGTFITAPEGDILKAKKRLAEKGFYVEPTTAATYTAFENNKEWLFDTKETIVLSLCGSGLKK